MERDWQLPKSQIQKPWKGSGWPGLGHIPTPGSGRICAQEERIAMWRGGGFQEKKQDTPASLCHWWTLFKNGKDSNFVLLTTVLMVVMTFHSSCLLFTEPTYKSSGRWLSGKESACPWRRHGFDPWVGKLPWRKEWQSTPVFLSGKSHGQRSLVGYSP